MILQSWKEESIFWKGFWNLAKRSPCSENDCLDDVGDNFAPLVIPVAGHGLGLGLHFWKEINKLKVIASALTVVSFDRGGHALFLTLYCYSRFFKNVRRILHFCAIFSTPFSLSCFPLGYLRSARKRKKTWVPTSVIRFTYFHPSPRRLKRRPSPPWMMVCKLEVFY